jgi:hypothetical protein
MDSGADPLMAVERIAITELEDAYVMCRALGHSWDDNPIGEVDSALFRASRGAIVLRCTRCATERFDYLANDMSVFARYYRYPTRYKSIPGQGTRPNLRGELLRRSLLIRDAHLRAVAKRRRNGSSA